MPTVQEMVAKKVAENKAESLAKKSVVSPVAPTTAPVNQVTSTDATKTQGTNNITFWAPTKTPVPVSTPTSVTQGATTPTPVAQTPVKAPQVIGEENGQPIYGTKPVAWVFKQDLNLPTAKGTQDNLQYSFDVKDPMNYMGTGMTQEQFKTLPLETQSAYTNAALANEEQKVGIIKQTQYAWDLTAQEELLKKQNAIKVENDRLSMENQAVQDNASVAKAQQDLATLKQNIWFLGQWGRPVQSQAVVDSYDRMLATSNQQYKDMVQIANNMRQMRENGIQFDENNYNAQLQEIHNDLKRNVDSVIQQAINGFSGDQIAGMIDSPEALQKLQNKYLDMIDTSVMGMTNRSIANLQTMQEVYKWRIATAQQEYQAYQESMQQYQAQQAEQQATFQKNQNTLNKDMSSALGYYVDGNWSPLLSSEWTTIAFKKDMPAPIFDRESGVMVTFEPDANGNPVGITKQIMQPSQSAQLEQQYKLMQMKKMEQEMNTPKAPETVKTENGTFQYNKDTGNYDIPIDKVTWSWVPVTDAIAKAIEKCKNWAQCGKFVNDVLENVGIWRPIGDSYESKVNAINKIWVATWQWDVWTGSIFTYPVAWSKYWHIGIVTWMNDDGTINLIDYNYKWDEQQRERTNVKISEITDLWGTISVPVVKNENTNTWPLTDKQFTQSNQIITSFKSDPQVKAFEEAYSNWLSLLSSLNDASWPWDIWSVFQFMKTLDPQSVVKEGEFALAAKSAWVWEQFKNIPANKLEGTILTPEQRLAFGKLAKQYIKDKSTIYQTKYKDWIKRLEKQGIDTSVFPTNMTDELEKYLWWNTEQQQEQDVNDEDIALFNKYM